VRVGESPDFYVPLSVAELPTQDYWQIPGVTILGRLNPGVSIAEAQSGLDPFLQEVEKSSALPQIERDESFAHVLLTPAPRGLSEARAKFSRCPRPDAGCWELSRPSAPDRCWQVCSSA